MRRVRLVGWLVLSVLLIAAAPTAAAATFEVSVLNNRFVPEVVEARAGDTLLFRVVEGSHQIAAEAGTEISGLPSERLAPGDQLELAVIDPPGEYFFFSDAEAGMRGGLQILDESPAFAIDNRISAGWFNPAAAGQGLLFEYVPATNVLVAYWFTFDFTSGEQLWLVGSGTPSEGRATLEMLSATGGVMNASDPVEKPVWGELTVDFSSCERATAWFNASNAQQSGQIPLDRLYLTSLCEQSQ
ncbi:MAG: hypothetical protein AAF552_17525 [Pseudomonadota bacterium]